MAPSQGRCGRTFLTSLITTQGSTGHKHLDGLDFIHMNGGSMIRPWGASQYRFLRTVFPDSMQGG